MCNRPDPNAAHLQQWITEGVALETHTMNHPCPLLQGGNFQAAYDNYHDCVDLLNEVPNWSPQAYRMTCFDSINNANPRFYAELFNKLSPMGHYLDLSSGICLLFTEGDPQQPAGLGQNQISLAGREVADQSPDEATVHAHIAG